MKVEVLGRPKCEWCVRVKHILSKNGMDFEYRDIYEDKEAMNLIRESKLTTVPQVWIDGVHIGGYEATEKYLQRMMSSE